MKNFETLILVPDNDMAGSKLPECANRWISGQSKMIVVHPPNHLKDVGELAPSEVERFRMDAMARAGLS